MNLQEILSHREIDANGCWNWTGASLPNGYGRVSWKGRVVGTHRVAAHVWLSFDLESDFLICHRCDNPRCFNPEHLFVGTPKDNTQDCVNKNRHSPWNCRARREKPTCKRGHLLAGDNLRFDGKGHRVCKTCIRLNTRNYRARKEVKFSSSET